MKKNILHFIAASELLNRFGLFRANIEKDI